MQPYSKNPRQITHKQMDDLKKTLAELGDLSGIVHDLNSDQIIGGNQRSRAMDVNTCEIELTHTAQEPDEQGTVALGFIVWQGKRYAYRRVRWTQKQCERANIIANKAGGSWDYDVLANEFDLIDLFDWGFEHRELSMVPEFDGNSEWRMLGEGEVTLFIFFRDKEMAAEALEMLTYREMENMRIRTINGEKFFDRWMEDLNENER